MKLGYQTSPSTRYQYFLFVDEQRGKSMVLQSAVDTRVGLLKDDCIEMDMEHRKQEDKIEKLHKQKEEEVSLRVWTSHHRTCGRLLSTTIQNSKLESEFLLIKSGMQTEERNLRQARDKNLEMEQENDSLSERITAL